MSIISGYQKIKKHIKTADGYQLLSHWTSSDTVEMNDGTTLEHRISNVDNTPDQDKPVSTPQQNALNQKADINSPALMGTPTAPTPSSGTNTNQIATTAFVQTAVSNGIAASDAMIIKGTIGTTGTVTALPSTYQTGWTYRVVTDGIYAGQSCEIGDLIIALVDRDGSDHQNSDWCIAQTNINGAITGVKSEDASIRCSQSGSVISITHNDAPRSNTSSTAKPSAGGTFTAVKSITSDTKGHVTGVETETVTLPALDAKGLGVVSTAASQGLSDTEKANARNNIGAVNLTGDTMTGKLTTPNLEVVSDTDQTNIIIKKKGANDTITRQGSFAISNSNQLGLWDSTHSKWICYSDANGNIILNGTANIANYVKTTLTNPSTASTYYIPFVSGNSTGNKGLLQNVGINLSILEGTASALGYNVLVLGNSTQSGTAGNKYGQLTIYGNNQYAGVIKAGNLTANRIILTPDKAGTIALTSDLSSYLPKSGGTMTGTLTVGGQSILFMENRVIKSSYANGIEFYRTDASGTGYAMWINNGGNDEFTPRKDGGSILGKSNARWGQIYSTNSTISTSDRRMKHDISYIGKDSEFDTAMTDDQLEAFLMGLMACIYRLNDGTSGRPHHGFVAQDIEELMEHIGLDDHAAFIKSPKTKDVEVEKEIEEEIEDPDTGEAKIVKKVVKELQYEEIPGEYIYSLRYEEFIADIIRFIQIQKNRTDQLEERVAAFEKKNADLESSIERLERLLTKQ